MKKLVLFSFCALSFLDCRQPAQEAQAPVGNQPQQPVLLWGENFIVKDSANKMLNSYLQSTSGEGDALSSLIFDAEDLRTYLSNTDIRHVKVMFAHTLDYINAGHQGEDAAYRRGELTLIMAGYDEEGNYVYYNGNQVVDHSLPCPTLCPVSGTAANDLLQ